jgi:HSP20 family protein
VIERGGRTMSKDDQFELDFGIGKISLNGLQKWVELASELENKKEIRKEGEIKGLPKNLKGMYGINVKTLVNKSNVETVGNIKRTEKAPVVKEERESLVDVFDEDDLIVVIAEMPGVSEQEISIEIKGQILDLTALGRERKYSRNIILPSKVIPSSMKTSHNNEVLKIIFQKDQEREGL